MGIKHNPTHRRKRFQLLFKEYQVVGATMSKDIYALTGHLHDQLNRISNPDIKTKELEVELARGKSIANLASQVIDGERVINERARIIAEHAPNNLVDVLRVEVVKDD